MLKRHKTEQKKLKSILWSFLIILPSILLGTFLVNNHVPVQYAYFVSCIIVLLAVFDFTTVVLIEQYRRKLGRATIPALLSAIFVILMFLIAASLSRFLKHLDYSYLTPFVVAAVLLIYIAIFREKNIVMKSYLSINSCALSILWAMGASDKIVMPF
ncbi:MAG: hypothetical protein K8R48_09230 [Alphaproteobacteria bacterium]|nr:hypothetical protein [Alphaproteobacteria bacterium]